MLRVIRTELYFDPNEIVWRSAEQKAKAISGINPGISAAFFHGNLEDFDFEQVLSNPIRVEPQRRVLDAFFDAALQNAPFTPSRPLSKLNKSIANKIIREPVIIEHSPPLGIPFGKLLFSAPVVIVGAILGIAGSPLMFATVPAGILAVGAPIVMLSAMNELVKRAFRSKDKPPTRPTETTKTRGRKGSRRRRT